MGWGEEKKYIRVQWDWGPRSSLIRETRRRLTTWSLYLSNGAFTVGAPGAETAVGKGGIDHIPMVAAGTLFFALGLGQCHLLLQGLAALGNGQINLYRIQSFAAIPAFEGFQFDDFGAGRAFLGILI